MQKDRLGKCALIAATHFTLVAAAADSVTIESFSLKHVENLEIVYTLDQKELISNSKWDPTLDPLPFDIRSSIAKAQNHLEATRQLQGPLFFSSFRLNAITVSADDESKRIWYYVFQFRSITADRKAVPGHHLTVVMLPDGQIAKMTLLEGTLLCPEK